MLNFNFLAKFKSFFGLNENNPQKNQAFNFSWNVKIINVSLEPARGELFLPLPLELPSQKIIQQPVFVPAIETVRKEEFYNNSYASWNAFLKPGEKKSFSCQFQAEISPVSFLPGKKFILSDYAKTCSDNHIFLSANRFLQIENPEIRKIAHKIAGTEKDVMSIIKKLNTYVASHLKYGQPILGLYSATDALNKAVIDCGGFASLLVSLCLALDIPARVVSGFWAGYENNAMHDWVEIQLPDGSWLPTDPTVENLRALVRTRKTGKLGFVGSDRIIFSYGCDLEIETKKGANKIDILQNPFYKGDWEDKIIIEHKIKTENITL